MSISTHSINIKGNFMRIFRKVLIALLAMSIFSNANARIAISRTAYLGPTYVVSIVYLIEDDGSIRDLKTGLIVTKQQAVDAIPTVAPILVGIIIGAVGGASVAIYNGADAKQALIAGFFGGVSGYYGALATLSGWFGVAVYGSGAIGSQLVGNVAIGPITVVQINEPTTPAIDYSDFYDFENVGWW